MQLPHLGYDAASSDAFILLIHFLFLRQAARSKVRLYPFPQLTSWTAPLICECVGNRELVGIGGCGSAVEAENWKRCLAVEALVYNKIMSCEKILILITQSTLGGLYVYRYTF